MKKNQKQGNFSPKRISQILVDKKKGKFTISEIGEKLKISPPQAYKWNVESPKILDNIHEFCKENGVTFEEIYKKI